MKESCRDSYMNDSFICHIWMTHSYMEYERVMSWFIYVMIHTRRIWMTHPYVTWLIHMNDSFIHEWLIHMSHDSLIWMTHSYMNDSSICHMTHCYEWLIHTWMTHPYVTWLIVMNDSFIHEWLIHMSHNSLLCHNIACHVTAHARY